MPTDNTQSAISTIGTVGSLGLGFAGMFSGGAGAAAAGGAGAAAGASVLGPIGLALGAGLAIYGGLSARAAARRRNRQIRRMLVSKYEVINKGIQENRLAFYDATQRNAKSAGDMISTTQIALSGFGSGASNNEYMAQIMADREYDQMILQRQQAAVERQAQYEKETAYAEAKAGAVSPVSAALQGAMGGFQTGMQLGNAAEGLARNLVNADASRALMARYNDELNTGGARPETLAAMSAISQGVEPRTLISRGNIVTSNPAYQAAYMNNDIQRMTLNQLQRSEQFSNWQMNAARGMMNAGSAYGTPGYATNTNIYNQMVGASRANPFAGTFRNIFEPQPQLGLLQRGAPTSSIFDFLRR